MPIRIIPQQKEGGKSDNTYFITCSNKQQAQERFLKSFIRLMDVNNWEKICEGNMKAVFTLCDISGKEVNRLAKQHDYLKIDIPGPGTIDGEGYDWVQIENISSLADVIQDAELISITVRPASCPQNDKASIAHFFTDDATSIFIIKKKGCTVTAEIYGRNEKPNEHTENIVDNLRNKVVANVAMIAFSNIQWKQ
jgi:hypothetical protein